MLISINGPIAGKLSIIQICDQYGALIRRLGYTPPSTQLDIIYGINIGWDGDELREKIQTKGETLLTKEQRADYYQDRVFSNVLSFVEVLALYIEERLKSLDGIQQGRVDTEINTEKAPRFFYNLPAGVVQHITNLITNHQDGLDFYTYDRLRMRIEMETATVIQTTGMIAPNPRCDNVVRSLINFRPKLEEAILNNTEFRFTHFAEYLLMWTYIARLYFGAVNIQDQDITSYSQPPIEAKTLQVGDDIIASLPSPSFESLKPYSNPMSRFASEAGIRYVSALNDYYLVRD